MTKETLASEEEGFPVVGLGASAGGLTALDGFFAGIPANANPGMAFVVVQHLAPDHKSMLADLVQRKTSMKVYEIEDGMPVEPNCVYIIPPGRDLIFHNGGLQLLEPGKPAGHRMPIDFFFRSLAENLHQRAIGIVLSGTGSDGTLGARAIKGEGGLVVAQSPRSAEHAGMPLSAIATGLVDFQLPPAEIFPQLQAYVRYSFGRLATISAPPVPKVQNAVSKIFLLLRAQTGHDFSQYKPSTIHRRIERRMALHQISEIEAYVKLLQQSSDEVEVLFRDMLIGVTSFFRDAAAFRFLAEIVIPQLFESKPAGSTIRIWIAGCSTGEEAYSMAMLFLEHTEKLKHSYMIQIFATDLDERAIAVARAGIFPSSIAADISPERLGKFFTPSAEGNIYHVRKGIRDMIVFSKQDLIKDPPFSRLDFLSCRNLMIYLSAELQKKLIPLFHYALNSKGILFLGSSEGIGEFDQLFSAVDRTSKIYVRRDEFLNRARPTPSHAVSPLPEANARFTQPAGRVSLPEEHSLRRFTERALLKQVFAVGALVNGQGDILYLHGRSGLFLEPSPGESGVNNILRMAREGLGSALTTALRKAVDTRDIIRHPFLKIKTNGHFIVAHLTVCPLTETPKDLPLYLVLIEEAKAGPSTAINVPTFLEAPKAASTTPAVLSETQAAADVELRISALKEELRAKEEFLQSTQEELVSSNEELRSSIEEMQSMNEELQSTNEELETSKEELQSINEELTTVNAELQAKVTDLSRVNNDMNNLISGTGIGTVFVGHKMEILRFTPAICAIINLIQTDVGRPISHIVSNILGYDSMRGDVQAVLDTLVPLEKEVQTNDGKWFSMRVRPYRTLENLIEGAVISFLDITDIVRAREDLRLANEISRAAAVIRDSFDAIIVYDLNGRTIAWNPGAKRQYGWSEREALAMNFLDRVPQELHAKEQETFRQHPTGNGLAPYESNRMKKDGTLAVVSVVSSALADSTGQVYAVAFTERIVRGEKE